MGSGLLSGWTVVLLGGLVQIFQRLEHDIGLFLVYELARPGDAFKCKVGDLLGQQLPFIGLYAAWVGNPAHQQTDRHANLVELLAQ